MEENSNLGKCASYLSFNLVWVIYLFSGHLGFLLILFLFWNYVWSLEEKLSSLDATIYGSQQKANKRQVLN